MVEKPQRSRASQKKRLPVPKGADPPHDRASGGRVHLYVGISLDGYIAAPDGGVDWLDPYSDARSGFMPFIKTIGCAIMGRVTYDHAVVRGYGSFGKMPSYVVTHRPFTAPSPSVIPFGPATALDLLKALDTDERMRGHYRPDAVRAHLHEMAGERERAIAHYRIAAERTTSIPERDYLTTKAARLIAAGRTEDATSDGSVPERSSVSGALKSPLAHGA